MASSAQYVASPKIDNAVVTTADTSRTQPTIANTGVVFTAGANGSRIDQINLTGVGTTVASQLRLFVCKGDFGKTISSITSSTTTATVTTAAAHGLITGDTVTIQGCMPSEFNVKAASITVTSTTTFTYTITSVSSVSATNIGYYSSTRVATAAQYSLLKETPVTAITPSATISTFNATLCSQYNPESFPIILPAGYSLRATVNDTQTSSGINVVAFGGDF
jgi:hypothetical protein